MRCLVLLVAVVAGALAQGSYKPEPHPREGYFQYTNVKSADEYDYGYKRGNAHHFRTHHQKNKDHGFQAKVTWGDSSGGQGEHYFEYNHGKKPEGQKILPVRPYA